MDFDIQDSIKKLLRENKEQALNQLDSAIERETQSLNFYIEDYKKAHMMVLHFGELLDTIGDR